ncbi:MAG: TlyA family RNA methyltransferase [Sulfurovum sp.]|uniref:23S rRNA (cytidine-2'-O)-methyltransferase TlyA n=1 Tax=Sulfurovum sp. TaxID=1969726 RepID=UPI0028680E1E|nr:TlyA family RNA methyltransferase [Sulfurovum sp.]MCO4845203.1 TlyA family RNA methyltransferase [Sulfurovum sp.]
MRLDKYLVDEAYFESRNRANDAIKAGQVMVDGKKAKASTKVDENTLVEVEDTKFYVSRAARKLENFLVEHSMDLQGKKALDIGSSTGGFAQIVLENAVATLSCVDVGKDQLHVSLRTNEKLSLHEETDIREFQSDDAFELITCDVSFISILQITDDIDRLSQNGTDIVILYKPQFEVGKDVKRDSKGVVQDLDRIARRKEEFEVEAAKLGWELSYQALSQVQGKEGNQEYLYHFVKMEK